MEWRAAALSHKISEHLQDQIATKLSFEYINNPSTVTSEALSVLSKLKTPAKGLESFEFSLIKLEEKLSETVFDQFIKLIKHLKVLKMNGW